jgi:hypothetical protein
MEAFNLTNTPHFANPQNSVNASNFGIISGTANSGREGIDERLFRLGVRDYPIHTVLVWANSRIPCGPSSRP